MTERDWDPELAWLQVHDSAFPSGRFVHSNGMEAWLTAHPAADEARIAELSAAHLRDSVASLDAVALAHAHTDAAEDTATLVHLDRLVRAHKLTTAARTASESSGRQLATTLRRVLPPLAGHEYLALAERGSTPANLPVVEGVATALLGIPRRTAVKGHLRSAHAAMLSAAVRLGRAGPLWAQRLSFATSREIDALARTACATDLTEMSTATPELEVHTMLHETLSVRLFRT